ncbi:hypothetical protein R6Q59_011528 [Mikania micrantha]
MMGVEWKGATGNVGNLFTSVCLVGKCSFSIHYCYLIVTDKARIKNKLAHSCISLHPTSNLNNGNMCNKLVTVQATNPSLISQLFIGKREIENNHFLVFFIR